MSNKWSISGQNYILAKWLQQILKWQRTQLVPQLTRKLLTTGTGVTGDLIGPIPSLNVYSAFDVLMIVHEAPSLTISLLGSFGHGVA